MPESFCLNQYRARAGEKLRKAAPAHSCARGISASMHVVRPSEPVSVGGEQREKESREWPSERSLRLKYNSSSRAHHYSLFKIIVGWVFSCLEAFA